jgi:hypothetical protein
MVRFWTDCWLVAFTVLTFCSNVVIIIGLVLEHQADFPKDKGFRKNRKTRPFGKGSLNKAKWGTALVGVGVGGEIFFGLLAFIVSIELSAQLGLLTAQANERAAKAQKAAEQEKLARLKFEKEYGPRQLTEAQRAALVKYWHKYAGKVVMLSRVDDPEAIYFAAEILKVLIDARLKVQQVPFSSSNEFVLGILVSGPLNDPALDVFARSLDCAAVFSIPLARCGIPGAPPPLAAPTCDLKIEIGFNALGERWRRMAEIECNQKSSSQ